MWCAWVSTTGWEKDHEVWAHTHFSLTLDSIIYKLCDLWANYCIPFLFSTFLFHKRRMITSTFKDCCEDQVRTWHKIPEGGNKGIFPSFYFCDAHMHVVFPPVSPLLCLPSLSLSPAQSVTPSLLLLQWAVLVSQTLKWHIHRKGVLTQFLWTVGAGCLHSHTLAAHPA